MDGNQAADPAIGAAGYPLDAIKLLAPTSITLSRLTKDHLARYKAGGQSWDALFLEIMALMPLERVIAHRLIQHERRLAASSPPPSVLELRARLRQREEAPSRDPPAI